jgi:hypothetical protein
MSVFGYGSSYPQPQMPVPQVGTWAPSGQQSRAARPINFNPDVTEAWQDPGQYISGYQTQNRSGGFGIGGAAGYLTGGPIGGAIGAEIGRATDYRGGGGSTPIYSNLPFENPLASLFQGQSNLAGPVSGKQFGLPSKGADLQNDPFGMYSTTTGKGGQQSTPGIGPMDPQQLYNQIGGLSLDQLQRLTPNLPNTFANFGAAAQDYANAYANPLYARQATMNQGQAQDWLKQSYDSLYNRLNASYLL